MPNRGTRKGQADTAALTVLHSTPEPMALLHALPDAIFVIDRQANVVFQNSTAMRIFESVFARMGTTNFRAILNGDEQDAFDRDMRQLVDHDIGNFSFYFCITESPTTKRCFEVAGKEFIAATGENPLITLSVRELESAGHSIQFLQVSYGRKTYWNWRNDFKSRTTSWPPELCKLMGISPEAGARMTADQVRALVHPRDRFVLRDVYKCSQEDRSPVVFHSRLAPRSGGYIECLTHGFVEHDKSGAPIGFVGFSCDITKEVEADRMLRENEMQLRELVEKISDLVMLRDEDGHILYVSPAAHRVLGYSPAELMDVNPVDFVHPDDIADYTTCYANVPTDGETISVTFRGRHANGHYIWLETKVRCLATTTDGRPARIASIARDITQRKLVEEALAAARERAEAASATKSRFLANMSHELRTPLNAIIGFSDIIHRELFGPAGNAQYKEYARLIQDSGAHLLDLINDVLDMSKIEAGKFELRLEEIDVEDMVRSSVTLMEPHAQKSKLMLVAKIGGPHRAVRADRRAVKQILLNLISNAVKFTPAGGLVTVSAENMMDGVAIQVSDTGIGIPSTDIERVTQPFEQVTADPMLAQAGSGLGLALVNSLVGLHMGRLKIDSVQGQGTVVSVFLPFDPRSRRAA